MYYRKYEFSQHEIIVGSKNQNKLGVNAGLQMQIPIYKNLCLASSTRYYIYPFTVYRPVPHIAVNYHSLMWDIGIGYRFKQVSKRTLSSVQFGLYVSCSVVTNKK